MPIKCHQYSLRRQGIGYGKQINRHVCRKCLVIMLNVNLSSPDEPADRYRIVFFRNLDVLWAPFTMSSVGTSIRLQRTDSFVSKSLTAMLKSSVVTSTLLQRPAFLCIY